MTTQTTITTETRGIHVYEIHHDPDPDVLFRAAAGRISVTRDGREEWTREYDCAAERAAALAAAKEQIPPTEDDPLAWGIGADRDCSPEWAGSWALYRVGIAPDGHGTAITYSSSVLARGETEALETAEADLRSRRAIDDEAALSVRVDRPRANPSPPSVGDLARYWVYGPDGWAHYDLRPHYRGPSRDQWWTGEEWVTRPYDGPVGRALT